MSTFRVEVVEIKEIQQHPNADRLDIVKVFDWNVVTRKGDYNVGDWAIYCPVDSILPHKVEERLFAPGSKIKLSKSRIKSIKIRKAISQGMLIKPESVIDIITSNNYKVGDDVSGLLGITKYEPPIKSLPQAMQAKARKANPNFKKYTDIENYKWYQDLFVQNEEVYISEKLHGTSFRAGWFKTEANTWWKKALKFFGVLPEWEFCWGSRNVQIQDKLFHTGYYDTDVYTKMVKQYDLKKLLPKGFAVYGEIVGDGIQKGYTYGCKNGEHKLYLYDMYFNEQFLDHDAFAHYCQILNLPRVPELFVGNFDKSLIDQYRGGDSTIGGQKVREGIVIKPIFEIQSYMGRKVLKCISDEYYLKQAEDEDSTEFH